MNSKLVLVAFFFLVLLPSVHAAGWTFTPLATNSIDYHRAGNDVGLVVKAASRLDFNSSTGVGAAQIYVSNIVGSPNSLTMRVETNSAGKPSGVLADPGLTATKPLASITTGALNEFDFNSQVNLTAATYWLVITTDGTDAAGAQYQVNYGNNGPGWAAAYYVSGVWTTQVAGVLGYDYWASYGYNYSASPVSAATIFSPQNVTYITANVTANVTLNMSNSTTALCWNYVDNVKTFSGNVTNGTSNITILQNLGIGSHNYTILCQPSSGSNFTSSQYFTRLDWLVQGETFTTPVYELTNQSYTGGLNTSENVAITSASMVFNGTTTAVNTSVSSVGAQYNHTTTFIIPLLQANNTASNVYWSFNLKWANGTTIVVNTSTSAQSIWFAYYLDTFNVQPSVQVEGQDVQMNATLQSLASLGTTNVTFYLNGTSAAGTLYGTNYTANITTPTQSSETLYYYGLATLNTSYGSTFRLSNSTNVTIIVNKLTLTNCSNSTNYILNFSFVDEEALTPLNSTMGISLVLRNPTSSISRSFNFSFTNVTSASICSVAGSYYVDSIQDYYSSVGVGYPVRHYYLQNATVNTTSATLINLYLLSNSLAKFTQINLVNQAGVGQQGYTVQVTRYYPSLNQYFLVAMGVTDQNGNTGVYIRPNDVQFRNFVYQNATFVQLYDPAAIPCDPGASSCTLQLTLTSDSIKSYLTKGAAVAFTCDNSTSGTDTIFTCVYSDPSSSLHTAQLQILWLGNYLNNTACTASSTSPAGALSCNLGNTTYKSYSYSFAVGFSPIQTIGAGLRLFTPSNQYGTLGIVIMILLVLAIGLLSMTSPVNGIVGVGVTLLLGQLLGFLYISYAGLIGLMVIVGVLALNNSK